MKTRLDEYQRHLVRRALTRSYREAKGNALGALKNPDAKRPGLAAAFACEADAYSELISLHDTHWKRNPASDKEKPCPNLTSPSATNSAPSAE